MHCALAQFNTKRLVVLTLDYAIGYIEYTRHYSLAHSPQHPLACCVAVIMTTQGNLRDGLSLRCHH